jgi:hypothetical protein
MRRRLLMIAAAAILLVPRPGFAVDEAAASERLGVRFGGLRAFDGLDEKYGSGWEMTLFFTEELGSRLLLDIRLGALYMGQLKDAELDDEITRQEGTESSMRIFFFSGGPLLGFSLGSSASGYVSAAAGIYSVSMEFESVLTAFDASEQYLGFSAGGGISQRIATSWCIEANCTVHYVLTGGDPTDLYYAFTGGADEPLIVGLGIGVAVDLR